MPFFFLNLSPVEFFTLLAGLSGAFTALYLLDRRKRKRVVSTLRFWSQATDAESRHSSRKMQQPWSLVLQLLGLLCLLLALAQIQWGTRQGKPKQHSLLVDTSTWSAAPLPGGGTVLDEEKRQASAYISGLPAQDRVQIFDANALATPLSKPTNDRTQLQGNINRLHSTNCGLDLKRAISLADGMRLNLSNEERGEIIYAGPGFSVSAPNEVAGLRVLPVTVPSNNISIEGLTAFRDQAEGPDNWRAVINLRNAGRAGAEVAVQAAFGSTRFAPRTLQLPAQDSVSSEYRFRTRTSANLHVHISSAQPSADLIAADDSADIFLPTLTEAKLLVYTSDPGRLRPFLDAERDWRVRYLDPANYRESDRADLMVFDRFAPARAPHCAALYIAPPAATSPVSVEQNTARTKIVSWAGPFLAGSGLHAEELDLPTAEIFRVPPGSEAVALTTSGAAAIATAAPNFVSRSVVIGFDVAANPVRLNVAAPLLIANAIRWLLPTDAGAQTFAAVPLGSVQAPLESGETADEVQVRTSDGLAVPFTSVRGLVQTFFAQPTAITLQTKKRTRVFNVSLANAPEMKWMPRLAITGLPTPAPVWRASTDLWKWLAIAGALLFTAEWIAFGRARRKGSAIGPASRTAVTNRERLSA